MVCKGKLEIESWYLFFLVCLFFLLLLPKVDHVALANEDKEDGDNPLGALEKAVLNLYNVEVQPRPARPNMRYIFAIVDQTNPNNHLDVGAESEEDMNDWISNITTAIQELADRCVRDYDCALQFKGVFVLKTLISPLFLPIRRREANAEQKRLKIHRDLSALIFYSQSVTFSSFEDSAQSEYYKMCSFAEKKAFSLLRVAEENQAKQFAKNNRRQISRVYPNGKRVDSSNFDPQVIWNAGCQMAALNYQTPDRHMWLNHGKFQQNGGCGYILKPLSIFTGPEFDPNDHKTFRDDPLTLHIQVFEDLGETYWARLKYSISFRFIA